jgi:hypothetical protein
MIGTLDSYESLAQPQSKKLNWRIILIDPDIKKAVVEYSWIDDSDNVIKFNESGLQYFEITDTDFDDVFGFIVRQQDVGTKIGVGLRALIWNKFKSEVLTAGNDGTFSAS